MIKELEKMIQKAAIDGTLTNSAADQIKATFEENKSLKGELESSSRDLDKCRDQIRELQNLSDTQSQKLADWQKRLNELADREKEITKLELTAKFATDRVEDHKNMVGLVFRNSELRRRTLGYDNLPMDATPEVRDQYGNTIQSPQPPGYQSVPIDKTTTETED